MPTKEEEYLKEIARLEEEKKQWLEERANFLKEQKASIVVFNEKDKENKNLNKSLEILTEEKKAVDERLEKLIAQNKEFNKELKIIKNDYSSLENQKNDLVKENVEFRKYRNYQEKQTLLILKEKKELKETIQGLTQKYMELEAFSQKQTTLINQLNNDLEGAKKKNQILEERLKGTEEKVIAKDHQIIVF
jgi:hypothetical protein